MNLLANTVVAWARQHRVLVLGLAVVVLLVSPAGISRLRFDTDVLSLLPTQGRAIPAFREFLRLFGGVDHLYVVFTAPPGHRIDEYRQQTAAWGEALRGIADVGRVDLGTPDNGTHWTWLADRQLLLLTGPRLDAAIARLQPSGMRESLLSSRALLAVPSREVADLVRHDPLGLLTLLRDELGRVPGLDVGAGADGYTTADGRRRLIVARPVRPPYDAAFSRSLFAQLDDLRRRLDAAPREDESDDGPIPAMTVEFAGGHRIAIETEELVRRESITNSVGSLALILPLLFAAFRSVWLVTVGAIPSVLSLILVLSALGFSGATLSAAAAGAAAMLFGLGIDGVVLLYATHRSVLAAGASDRQMNSRLGAASASMLLGMWTTAATFYGLMLVDFPSLTQLGTLLGHSMAVCGILTLLLVPALLPRRRQGRVPRAVLMPGMARAILKRRRMLLVGAAGLTLVLGLAATRVKVNPTLEKLRSVSAGAQLEEQIARSFGLPGEAYMLLDRGPDLEALLRQNEALTATLAARVPGVAVQAPTMLLPSRARQEAVLATLQRQLPDPRSMVEALQETAGSAGFMPNALAPFVARLPRLAQSGLSITLDGYAQHGAADMLERFVRRDRGDWVLATYVFPRTPSEVSALEQAIAASGGTARLTGLPLVNRELSAAFVPQFLKGLALGTVAVVLLILFTFRAWQLSFLALVPTAVGLLWAAGLLALLGAELDLFAMFAVVTFVGIGVDYGVHLVHRFQETGDVEIALAELAPVILVAGGITACGYGMLVTSAYPPLQSMGVVSIVSVISLIAASVVVLPLLLATLCSDDRDRRAHSGL